VNRRWSGAARWAGAALVAVPAAGGVLAGAPAARAAEPVARPAMSVGVPAGLPKGRLLVLRAGRLELAVDGRVLRSIPLGGPLDLARLPALVRDPDWASSPRGGVVRLGATLAARPGTTVRGTYPSLRRLELSPTGAGAAQLLGTGAGLRLDGVTVTGGSAVWLHGSVVRMHRVVLRGEPAVRGGQVQRRPVLRVGRGGHVDLRRVRVTGGERGVLLQDVADAVVDRLVTAGTRGDALTVDGGSKLRVTAVTVGSSHGDGVVLTSVRGLLLDGVHSRGTRGAAVRVRQSRSVTVSRLTSRGDALAVSATDATDLRVTRLSARGAGAGVAVRGTGSLRLDTSVLDGVTGDALELAVPRAEVARVRVTDAREALVVGSASRGLAVRDSALGGRRAGVRAAAGSSGAVLTRVRVDAPDGAALRLAAPGVRLVGCTVTGAQGIAVRAGGGGLSLTDTDVEATGAALDVSDPGASVAVHGGRLDGGGARAVGTRGGLLVLSQTAVGGGAAIGVDVRAATVPSTATTTSTGASPGVPGAGDRGLEGRGVTVDATAVAVRAAGPVTVRIDGSALHGTDIGVQARAGASGRVVDTTVTAARAATGDVLFEGDEGTGLPLRPLGLIAVGAVLLAMLLEVVRLRDRADHQPPLAPAHVVNRT